MREQIKSLLLNPLEYGLRKSWYKPQLQIWAVVILYNMYKM